MAFDEAWRKLNFEGTESPDKKLDLVLASIQEHPFSKEFPEEAIEIAKFRTRLLGLN